MNAIVSRDGRPDLADPTCIKNLKVPTLLIVGQKDSEQVIELNKKALKQLKSAISKEMVMIPNAGYLSKEKGTIEQGADLSIQWYEKHIQC
jgi:pimeloyl-ACP methyl ester carboxylesterase